MTCKLASRLFVTVSAFSELNSRPPPSDEASATKASSEGEFARSFTPSPSSITANFLNGYYINSKQN